MDLRIFIEPQQGASYDDQLRMAKASEDLGFDAFFRSDHFLTMGTEGLPGPTDSWVTLGAIARETERIRLGTMVTSTTFRHPGLLAITVAQVDQMSGGRVELGLGAGWFEREHAAYGIEFPDVVERFDRFEEALAIVTGLWATRVGETFSFPGTHFRLEDSPALPKPAQSDGPPVIIGGQARKRTAALTARYAHEFNSAFADVTTASEQFGRVRAACAAGGRDPESLVLSNALTTCCGSDDAAVAARADRMGVDLAKLRTTGLVGSPDQLVERIGEYGAIGSTRIYLQLLDLADLDHLELLANRVLPQCAQAG